MRASAATSGPMLAAAASGAGVPGAPRLHRARIASAPPALPPPPPKPEITWPLEREHGRAQHRRGTVVAHCFPVASWAPSACSFGRPGAPPTTARTPHGTQARSITQTPASPRWQSRRHCRTFSCCWRRAWWRRRWPAWARCAGPCAGPSGSASRTSRTSRASRPAAWCSTACRRCSRQGCSWRAPPCSPSAPRRRLRSRAAGCGPRSSSCCRTSRSRWPGERTRCARCLGHAGRGCAHAWPPAPCHAHYATVALSAGACVAAALKKTICSPRGSCSPLAQVWLWVGWARQGAARLLMSALLALLAGALSMAVECLQRLDDGGGGGHMEGQGSEQLHVARYA